VILELFLRVLFCKSFFRNIVLPLPLRSQTHLCWRLRNYYLVRDRYRNCHDGYFLTNRSFWSSDNTEHSSPTTGGNRSHLKSGVWGSPHPSRRSKSCLTRWLLTLLSKVRCRLLLSIAWLLSKVRCRLLARLLSKTKGWCWSRGSKVSTRRRRCEWGRSTRRTRGCAKGLWCTKAWYC
jgi:hypothetical protein